MHQSASSFAWRTRSDLPTDDRIGSCVSRRHGQNVVALEFERGQGQDAHASTQPDEAVIENNMEMNASKRRHLNSPR